MFEDARAYAYIPVPNLDDGRAFYEGTLGFKRSSEVAGDGVGYQFSDNTGAFMYLTDAAGTNQASTLMWAVDDVAAEVAKLSELGVDVMHYDIPGMPSNNGVFDTPNGGKAAWFKDPFGNTLALIGS